MPTIAAPTPPSTLLNFDPRAVAVAATDAHLPAVGQPALNESALRKRFLEVRDWQPEVRVEPKYAQRTPMAASVLIAIVVRDRPTVLLTQRTAHLSTHSGQIAFPGGKQDVGDADQVATALREAREEIGLEPEFIQVLGSLPIYVTGTSFIITPVVGLVRDGFSLVRNADEVDEVFEVPLEFLMNPANHRRHVMVREGLRREWISMPYQDGANERFIWGATAAMLRNFYRFLSA